MKHFRSGDRVLFMVILSFPVRMNGSVYYLLVFCGYIKSRGLFYIKHTHSTIYTLQLGKIDQIIVNGATAESASGPSD